MEQDITPEQAYLSVYFCGKENCEPGHSFGPAVRPHYLLHVVLDGKGFYRKNGVTYSLHKGDAFLIPPMESTYYEADQEDPWTYAWVGFDGKNCKQTLRQTVFSHSFVFLNSVPEKTAQICDAMAFLLQSFQNSHGNQLQLTGSLLLLLSHMRNTVDGKREEFTHRYFQKAQEYIENNYSYDIKISDIARHVGIDRTYLYRIFIEEEQLSPKQYLMQHRIRIATQMLSSASYTITEIAFSCGFKDSPSFCNHFKKQVGVSPRKFRQNFLK